MDTLSFTRTGKPHLDRDMLCEDFARAGVLPDGRCYAVVSDGCGGATVPTYEGAKVTAKSFVKALKAGAVVTHALGDDLLPYIAKKRKDKDLSAYLATLVGAVGTADRCQAFLHGDGVVAVRQANGELRITEVSWFDNAPYFLAYALDESATSRMQTLYASDTAKPVRVRHWQVRAGAGAPGRMHEFCEYLSFSDMVDGMVLEFFPVADGITDILVATDGAGRIEGWSLPEAVLKMFTASDTTVFEDAALVLHDDVGFARISFR